MPSSFPLRPVLLACLIVSIGQLSVGLLFPALPSIAQNFSLNAEQVQRLISFYLLGFGPSQLLYGPFLMPLAANLYCFWVSPFLLPDWC